MCKDHIKVNKVKNRHRWNSYYLSTPVTVKYGANNITKIENISIRNNNNQTQTKGNDAITTTKTRITVEAADKIINT